ncbi:MAG: methyl-accepting chemotaxis protein [Granulosicoccus sp.]|jgi:methyl-accepting chemotaxis protein
MKESKMSVFAQLKSSKKVVFLTFVIVLALGAVLLSSYQLLGKENGRFSQEREYVGELQGLFTVLPSLSIALKEDPVSARGRIDRVRRDITASWEQLKASSSLATDDVETVGIAIDESFKYLDLLSSGGGVNELSLAKLTVPVFNLQTAQNNMMNVGSSNSTTKVQGVVISVMVIIIALLIIAGILWSDASKSFKASEEEDLLHQSAILRLLDELASLADGDLTVTTTVSEDFTGAIADSVNYTIDQLRQLVSRINTTAVQVSSAAQDSQQTVLHLAEASDHQAQEIAGASAAINEMAVTIDQVSANAAESALVASKSVSIAHNGSKMVQNTIRGMDTIREQIQDTSKRIKRLGESTQEIGDIVSLINDIADQTNILALNAAIQASMAGDAGRGFAVVADEVQRLAERSAGATKQIGSLVKTIQTDTNEAVKSMEQTTTEVVSGAHLAQDAGVALEEIEGVSANLAELIQNISNAARQQASSAGHISNTMSVIQEITSQTSAGTGATAHAIGDLADMALELREFVAGFKLPDDMNAAIPLNRDEAVSPPALNVLPIGKAAPAKTESPVSRAPAYSSFAGGAQQALDSTVSEEVIDDEFSHFLSREDTADLRSGISNEVAEEYAFEVSPPVLESADVVPVTNANVNMADDNVLAFIDSEDSDDLEEEFTLDDLDFIDEKPTAHT